MNVPRVVFADASFFIALLSRPDADRDRAFRWYRYLTARNSQFVTTEAVLWEWLNFFSARGREQVMESYRRVRSDPSMEVVPFDPDLCESAIDLYEARPDQEWGITDCLSFEVMRQRGLTAALTLDHHFVQAGFVALLREEPPE